MHKNYLQTCIYNNLQTQNTHTYTHTKILNVYTYISHTCALHIFTLTLSHTGGLREQEACQLFAQIVSAIYYCHQRCVSVRIRVRIRVRELRFIDYFVSKLTEIPQKYHTPRHQAPKYPHKCRQYMYSGTLHTAHAHRHTPIGTHTLPMLT